MSNKKDLIDEYLEDKQKERDQEKTSPIGFRG
jgi:hypothetical protein